MSPKTSAFAAIAVLGLTFAGCSVEEQSSKNQSSTGGSSSSGQTSTRGDNQNGPTIAPDLESVGNFRPGPADNNGDPRTYVNFTFDQATYLNGGNRTSFHLVPMDGSKAIDGSGFKPPASVDREGNRVVTVLFNGQLNPATFARGYVDSNTVSSGPQGNATFNINQAQDIVPNNTTKNPDLVSIKVNCRTKQALFRFDEPLDQEDVVQNTGGLRLYFRDTKNAGVQSVNQTNNPRVLKTTFTDLPQGKKLNNAVGVYATQGTVAGQPPDGPGGQAGNAFDEVSPVQFSTSCATSGSPGGNTGNGNAGGGTPGGGVSVGAGKGGAVVRVGGVVVRAGKGGATVRVGKNVFGAGRSGTFARVPGFFARAR